MASKAKKSTQRKLTAILCADVVGYSRLMGADEEATVATLTAYRKVFTSKIKRHSGRVVDAKGDALLAEFASVVDAVKGAVEIQRELAEKNAELSDDRRMDFRIGINLGDVVVKDDVIYGDGVNVAARLEALAEPGGICISRPVYDQVESKLHLECEYLGEQQVKNIAKPVRAYSVNLTQADVDKQVEPPDAVSAQAVIADGLSLELPDRPSIAVLAFQNMSGDPEQEYFSDGITEDIITDLSKIPELFVIARNSSFSYKGRAVTVQQVGQEMGVRYVLEGSVRKSGERVRITAQLVDAQSGHHRWAERYDRDMDDLFSLQDEITSEIVSALDVELVSGEGVRQWRTSVKNAEARDCLYRGNRYLLQLKKETGIAARRMFERVIELEPEFAGGYVSLAWTYIQEVGFGDGEISLESLDKAAELAKKAISLDEGYGVPYSIIANVHLYLGEHEQALAETLKATELEPNNANVNIYAANVLGQCDRAEEGVTMAQNALRLSPVYAPYFLNIYARNNYLCGRNEQAITAFKAALELNAGFSRTRAWLAAIYMQLEREAEAKAEAREVLKINPRFSLASFSHRLLFKDKEIRDALLANMRKAGLPE